MIDAGECQILRSERMRRKVVDGRKPTSAPCLRWGERDVGPSLVRNPRLQRDRYAAGFI
jgi:hypothetical protein